MLNMTKLTNLKEKQPILYSFIREMAMKEYEWLIHSGNTTNYSRKKQEKFHTIHLKKLGKRTSGSSRRGAVVNESD